MRIIRKTNIVVKTKRRLTTHNKVSNTSETILCPQCGEAMFDAESAAQTLQTSVREVYRLVEAGKLHFFENEDKIGFMCPKSCEMKGENNRFLES